MPNGVLTNYVDEVTTPSQGRVRAVRMPTGQYQYQDPDLRITRTYPDGSQRVLHDLFIRFDKGIDALTFDFEKRQLFDSFGVQTPFVALGYPKGGVRTSFINKDWRHVPLTIDPRKITPAPNQEIVEKITFVDSEGKVFTKTYSMGYGKKYDLTRTKTRFVQDAKRAKGIEWEEKVTTDELKQHVLHRQFLLKTTITRRL